MLSKNFHKLVSGEMSGISPLSSGSLGDRQVIAQDSPPYYKNITYRDKNFLSTIWNYYKWLLVYIYISTRGPGGLYLSSGIIIKVYTFHVLTFLHFCFILFKRGITSQIARNMKQIDRAKLQVSCLKKILYSNLRDMVDTNSRQTVCERGHNSGNITQNLK